MPFTHSSVTHHVADTPAAIQDTRESHTSSRRCLYSRSREAGKNQRTVTSRYHGRLTVRLHSCHARRALIPVEQSASQRVVPRVVVACFTGALLADNAAARRTRGELANVGVSWFPDTAWWSSPFELGLTHHLFAAVRRGGHLRRRARWRAAQYMYRTPQAPQVTPYRHR